MCDKDGDGKITIEELFTVMKELNVQTTKLQVKSLFLQLDQDDDGYISLDEFNGGIKQLRKVMNVSQKLSSNSFESKSSQSKQNEKNFEILSKYVGNFVENIVKKAEEECKNGNFETAKILMQLVHSSGLGEVEKKLEQQICTEYTVDNYKRIVHTISQALKKNSQ